MPLKYIPCSKNARDIPPSTNCFAFGSPIFLAKTGLFFLRAWAKNTHQQIERLTRQKKPLKNQQNIAQIKFC